MKVLETSLERLNQERQILINFENKDNNFNLQEWKVTDTNEVHVKFSFKIGTIDFNGVLIYPEFFPDIPAYIKPQKSGERWSVLHQYGGSGVLCLEYGPDNWHTDITGEDLIKSARRLLLTDALRTLKSDIEPVPSRHSETEGQKIRKTSKRLIQTPMLQHILNNLEYEKVEIKGTLSIIHETAVFVVTNVQNKAIVDIPPSFADELNELFGWAIRTDSFHLIKESVTDLVSFQDFLKKLWPSEEFLNSINLILVYDLQGHMELFFFDKTSSLFLNFKPINIYEDNQQRLPSVFNKLKDLKIAIIGLGSLGSKVAISLARSGCKSFILIDDDFLAPHNIVRNELNWLDIGFPKTYAVERALKRIDLDIQVKTYEMQIGGQENPHLNSNIANAIATCNLIIDATANTHTFLTLAAIAKRKHIAIVWGEIFGGGGGAMMARSRPTLDASPLELRNHIYGVLQTLEPIPGGKVNNYGFQTQNQTYIASDADVTALAASMTQFTLDTLCTIDEQSSYPYSAYLIGFRKYWIFQCPFDTHPIDCSGALVTESPTDKQISESENGNSIEEPEPIKG